MPRDLTGVRVGPSPIHGAGVFATRDFAPGDIVLALDDSRIVDADHPLRAEYDEYPYHCDHLAGGRVVLQAWPERHINSSCAPSTYVQTRGGVRYVIARRPISAGDEITYDYLINCHGGVVWRCECASPSCRETIPGSFFDLPVEDQQRLRALLDDWFVAEHRGRLDALRARGGTAPPRRGNG